MKKSPISRRSFLGTAAAAGAAGIVIPALITSCAPKHKNVILPVMLDKAPDGPLLKAGLIGCGGRGTGAAINFIHAGPNLTISALGDVFTDRVTSSRERLAQDGVQIADENCFTGFDAYQKVIESGVDIILLATPPVFRPEHVEAAVSAGKHVFMEKPVAVDPVGIHKTIMKKSPISRRSFLGTAAAAGAAGIVIPALITSCAPKHKNVILPVMLDKAPDGPLLKAGLIGCGGRGTGAAINFIHSGPNLTISALGDV